MPKDAAPIWRGSPSARCRWPRWRKNGQLLWRELLFAVIATDALVHPAFAQALVTEFGSCGELEQLVVAGAGGDAFRIELAASAATACTRFDAVIRMDRMVRRMYPAYDLERPRRLSAGASSLNADGLVQFQG
jgi:hypothetical protein